MLQLGWLVASSTVALAKSSAFQSLKAPPDAVNSRLAADQLGLGTAETKVQEQRGQALLVRLRILGECSNPVK